MCNPTSLFCLFSWQFYCKIFKIFETPSWLKPEQLYRLIKLLESLRNMSKVLRCEGLKHSCAFLMETGPAQTTPISQTLMLFSVILLNCTWGSWAHQTSTMSLSSQGQKFLSPWVHCVRVSHPRNTVHRPQLLPHVGRGCTVWVSHLRNTVTSHSSYPMGGGGKHCVSVSPKKHSVQATAPTPPWGGEKGRGTVWECLTQETQWPGHSSNTNIVHWILGPMFSQEYQSNNHLAFTVIWGNRRGLKWFLLSYYLV